MFRKEVKKTLIAGCALTLCLSATAGGIRLLNADAESTVVNPIAKYDFNDETNLGKDTMGNWDLKTEGTVTKTADGAHFDGNSALYAESGDKDISEKLTCFTLNFTMTPELQSNDARTCPIGFGWNDWSATKWCWFTLNQHGDTTDKLNPLRFSTHGGGDGTTGRDWGKECVSTITAGTTYRLTLTAEVGGKATVYVDGASVYSYALPEDWNLQDNTMRFAIGNDWVWDSGRSGYYGAIGAVSIYDFSMSATEVAAYWTDGKLTNDELVKTSASETDYTSTITVEANASREDILKQAPTYSTVGVTMSDATVRHALAYWDNVAVKNGETYLEGSLKGIYNPDNVKAYAKISVLQTAVAINPIAKYEFKDPTNPGKDSMGNYDLTVKDADGKKDGTVAIADGAATFNGTAGLLSQKDISEDLTSFTMSYEMKIDANPSTWVSPVSFGWNDWEPTKWATFQIAGGSDLLRFSSANSLVGEGSKVSDIDGHGNAYWGHEIGNLGTAYHKVTLTVQLGGKIVVYFDNVAKYTFTLPADFTLKNDDMKFSIGGESCWGNIYVPFTGSIKNIAFYDFAMTANQVKTCNDTGVIKTNSLTGTAYVESADVATLSFADNKVTTATVYDKMPESEKVSLMGKATVTATLSDASTKVLSVVWTGVSKASEGNVWTAYGYVQNVGLGIPSIIAEKIAVTKIIEVQSSYGVSVAADIVNGSVVTDISSGIPGDVVTLTVTPAAHYQTESVLVNGTAIQADDKGVYKTTIADADVVVSATFKAISYTISAEGMTHGTVTFSAESATFDTVIEVTPVPEQYYVLTKMYINGEELVRNAGKYTFKVTGNMVVTATFVEAAYSLDSYVTGGHGTVSLDKQSAKGGETVAITITPDENYEIASVKLNGVNLAPVDGNYSFTVEGDSEIEVIFKAKTVTPPDSSTSDSSKADSSSGKGSSENTAGCGSVAGMSAAVVFCGAAIGILLKKKRND